MSTQDTNRQQKVLDALTEHKAGLTHKELADHLGSNIMLVSMDLIHLEGMGKVHRRSVGREAVWMVGEPKETTPAPLPAPPAPPRPATAPAPAPAPRPAPSAQTTAVEPVSTQVERLLIAAGEDGLTTAALSAGVQGTSNNLRATLSYMKKHGKAEQRDDERWVWVKPAEKATTETLTDTTTTAEEPTVETPAELAYQVDLGTVRVEEPSEQPRESAGLPAPVGAIVQSAMQEVQRLFAPRRPGKESEPENEPFNCLIDLHGKLHIDLPSGEVVVLDHDDAKKLSDFLGVVMPAMKILGACGPKKKALA